MKEWENRRYPKVEVRITNNMIRASTVIRKKGDNDLWYVTQLIQNRAYASPEQVVYVMGDVLSEIHESAYEWLTIGVIDNRFQVDTNQQPEADRVLEIVQSRNFSKVNDRTSNSLKPNLVPVRDK